MAWSDAARAAAAEARRRNSISKEKKYSFRTGPFRYGMLTAAQIVRHGGVEWGTKEKHWSLKRPIKVVEIKPSRSKLVDLTKLVNMQVNPMLSHFGKPLTQKQMSAPKGSIRKYSKMGGDRRYK